MDTYENGSFGLRVVGDPEVSERVFKAFRVNYDEVLRSVQEIRGSSTVMIKSLHSDGSGQLGWS